MVKLPKLPKTAPNPPVPQPVVQVAQPVGAALGKERELFAQQDAVAMEEIRHELEVPPEVESAGVETRSETINLPEVVEKMGVVATDINQPLPILSANLPIADDKIITGFGAPVVTSLRWLVEWCTRQLKKVHVRLKNIHGKIVRVVTR